MTPPAPWIAVDWGTTHLRAWRIGPDERPSAARENNRGMAGLGPADFEPALLALIGDWLPAEAPTEILCAGMVGARQGWCEAGYATLPCPPVSAAGWVAPPVADPRLRVRILPGLAQDCPPDAIRGEEVQIAGYLRQNKGFAGVLCLPGTHSKWVEINAGNVRRFTSFLTGEIFALLSSASVLSHAIDPEAWEDGAFENAIAEAHRAPDQVAARLFGLRAAALFDAAASRQTRARLSGLLIGLELAGARDYLGRGPVPVIGAPRLAGLYTTALGIIGQESHAADATAMTIAGLAAARALNPETAR